ncbi:uncharacterized protein SPSK_06645 [Sporothrix schenckii 1099-18]|uniref:Uncharacterized protein n=1 Tax=Sporothrix schenckii 1099-18 TaxID=1397361 RepID=A0A0F2MIY3_SPOSC|nr:uncharacterized protein SPSK_06645 [Sporothrix schenckii 1099-18]KJR89577.1 hypothetical protein SPSK_06645 [Sporothrix schenckii 1099-18]
MHREQGGLVRATFYNSENRPLGRTNTTGDADLRMFKWRIACTAVKVAMIHLATSGSFADDGLKGMVGRVAAWSQTKTACKMILGAEGTPNDFRQCAVLSSSRSVKGIATTTTGDLPVHIMGIATSYAIWRSLGPRRLGSYQSRGSGSWRSCEMLTVCGKAWSGVESGGV